MKIRIERFSIHQNAKVFAVIMAVSSLVFVVPLFLFASMRSPRPAGFPGGLFFLLLPLIYLVIGYIGIAIGCWVYNLLAKITGGLEFESEAVEA
jgi:hypothetical protein